MKSPPQSLAMCAPLGFDEARWGVVFFVVLGIYVVIGLVGYFLVRDFFRFGRRGFPWLLAVIGSCIFSAGGYLLVGPVGTIVGAPFLVAFGIGRCRGQSSSESAD